MPRPELQEMGRRARRHVQNAHTYEALAQQYAQLF
jgi:hypothetical protein